MNVLFTSFFGMGRIALSNELEFMQRHLDAGDTILQLYCNAILPACFDNPHHELTVCWTCMARRKKGLSYLSEKIESQPFLLLTDDDREELARLQTEFQTVEELKAYCIEEFDIGLAVASSLISITKDPYPDPGTHATVIKNLLVSSFVVYRSIQNHLDSRKISKIYAFNGRLDVYRAVLRACQNRETDCYIHEHGPLGRYVIFKNALPQDLALRSQEIIECWNDDSSIEEKRDLAREFYEGVRKATDKKRSFILDQKEAQLPAGWNANHKNIVLFTSSEDEFQAIGKEWSTSLYQNQEEGIRKIVKSLRDDRDGLHLYIRIHPRLRDPGIPQKQIQSLLQIKEDFVTVIPPGSPISTYALLDKADIVLTFGSTVGIEAVYWGKPSVLAGNSLYHHLGGTYKPASHEEVIDLLTSNLAPKDKKAAIMYGYWMKSHGSPYEYYEDVAVNKGTFKGRFVKEPYWFIQLRRIYRKLGHKYFNQLAVKHNYKKLLSP